MCLSHSFGRVLRSFALCAFQDGALVGRRAKTAQMQSQVLPSAAMDRPAARRAPPSSCFRGPAPARSAPCSLLPWRCGGRVGAPSACPRGLCFLASGGEATSDGGGRRGRGHAIDDRAIRDGAEGRKEEDARAAAGEAAATTRLSAALLCVPAAPFWLAARSSGAEQSSAATGQGQGRTGQDSV
jgi:hypothetical protein